MYRIIGATLALAMMGGCASITKGTSQEIRVNSEPQGAACEVLRKGQSLAKIAKTPATVKIKKSKYNLEIVCSMEGFADSTHINNSGVEGMTAANAIAGGLIGWAIDSATGADNKYDGNVTVYMRPPNQPAAPQTPNSVPPEAFEIDPDDPNYGNPDAVPQS